jgi:hypothetical protein
VHTEKKSGKQKISLKRWPDAQAAKVPVAAELGKIEWEALDEPPPAALTALRSITTGPLRRSSW